MPSIKGKKHTGGSQKRIAGSERKISGSEQSSDPDPLTRNNHQKRLKDLEAQKIEEENAQIVQMVKAVHLDGAQLAAFLSAYANGEIILPQPDTDYTDEQEETEDEA